MGLGADGGAVIKIFTARSGVSGIPGSLDGVPVVVEVTGRFVALTDPTDRQLRPVPTGVSTGHRDITAGTIGARVTDGTSVFALSNNHVYANGNDANIGDSSLEPGAFDGGVDPSDKIGELSDFEPIDYSGGDNIMDAAIALSSTAMLGNSTPSGDGYGTPNSATILAYVGQAVQKYGRTTKLTNGQVSEISVTVNVCYETQGPFKCKKSARFVDQFAITGTPNPGDFSAGGDSGSLIVTDDGYLKSVGLLFAGSSTRTIANRIDPVLSRFNVYIDGGSPASGSITGMVTDTSGEPNPIEGAAVSADRGESATTASDGSYTLMDVPAGGRTVTASASGYQSAEQVVTVTDGGAATAEFALATQPMGTIAGTVTDASSLAPVGGAMVSADTGESATTAADGTYTLMDVALGDRTVTASVGGYQTAQQVVTVTDGGTATAGFALDPVTTASDVFVASVTYATEGGKMGDKHLLFTVALLDDLGGAVGGASVSIQLDNSTTGQSWIGNGTTGGSGTVTFTLKNVPSGAYITSVTGVSAGALTWDNITPANSFTK